MVKGHGKLNEWFKCELLEEVKDGDVILKVTDKVDARHIYGKSKDYLFVKKHRTNKKILVHRSIIKDTPELDW